MTGKSHSKRELAQQVVMTVSRILSQEHSHDESYKLMLEGLCEQLGWSTSAFWKLNENDQLLSCEMLFSGDANETFQAVTKLLKLKRGEGLPGRVWQQGLAMWIKDVVEDGNFPRSIAAKKDGLHAAFAFPVTVSGKFIGVFEFFSREISEPDVELTTAFGIVGTELGQFFERRRMEVELAESERRFRDFARAVDEVFFVGSEQLTEFYYVSPAYEQIWEETPEQGIANPLNWFAAVIPEHKERVAEYARLLKGDNMPGEVEIDYAIKRSDGNITWLSARCFRIETPDGRWNICGTVRDITQRKIDEQRIGEFYSVASHELRTPLTSVKGSLLLLERGRAGVLPSRAHKLTRIALKECDRLIRLVNDMLDIKTIEAGKLELGCSEFDPREVIHETLEMMQIFADDYNVNLKQELNASTMIHADKDRISQVLTNLISNAIKFSPKGGVVTVQVDESLDSVRYSVVDNGLGIPLREQYKLFKVFVQLNSANGVRRQGTGLGLAICKGIVDEHGGKLGVISDEGKGATFWFELPVNS